ncbi:MAG: hypothetical protein HXX16_13825 [Bacteroidales bacterium]|nr:hypothetical protein [Bacteroidales bacterium]
MDTKYTLLSLFFSFLILGFVQAFAERPVPISPPLSRDIPSGEEEDPTRLDFKSNENGLCEYKFYSSDSSLSGAFYPFLTIRPNYSLDSSSFIEVMKYLKKIIPAANEIEDPDFDMIEVL